MEDVVERNDNFGMIEVENPVTIEVAEEVVRSNDLVIKVGMGHRIDVVINGSLRYQWRIELIGDRYFSIRNHM